jgi:hypothetical protein
MSTPTPEHEAGADAASQAAADVSLEPTEGAVAIHDLLDFELVEVATRVRINLRLRTGLSCS